MIVAVAADHAGFPLKARVLEAIRSAGCELLDLGVHAPTPAVDYPDTARAVGRAVLSGQADRGILLCGSSAGVVVAANKMRGVRAAVAHDTYTAHQMVEHDHVNVCCMGARVIGPELAAEVAAAFMRASFTNEERHVRRLQKVLAIEQEGA